MTSEVGRRDFVRVGTAAGLALAGTGDAFGRSPEVLTPSGIRPIVISSANGNQFVNGGPRTCVAEAFERMLRGEDVLDALIAGVNIVELDPLDDSVGYGGLPNAEGVVQLDASAMHGPTKRAGAVAALEGVRTASRVAKAVLDHTDHHLLVGEGAQRFARQMGFEVEDDLNTPHSRELWLNWKQRIDPGHWLDPESRGAAMDRARSEMLAEGLIDPRHYYGTVNCNGVNARGEIGGVTTTSGLAWKIPGRVGDSPILGAGLYVDGDVGAAGSTGRGEANLFALCSFLIVEQMRRGAHPKDAGMEALRRVKANTLEKRLLKQNGEPDFNLKFYVVNRTGEFAGLSLWAGEKQRFAVCTEKGPETLFCESLLGEPPA